MITTVIILVQCNLRFGPAVLVRSKHKKLKGTLFSLGNSKCAHFQCNHHFQATDRHVYIYMINALTKSNVSEIRVLLVTAEVCWRMQAWGWFVSGHVLDVLCCWIKIVVFLYSHVFWSCFGTVAVIFVLDLFLSWKKHLQLSVLLCLLVLAVWYTTVSVVKVQIYFYFYFMFVCVCLCFTCLSDTLWVWYVATKLPLVTTQLLFVATTLLLVAIQLPLVASRLPFVASHLPLVATTLLLVAPGCCS